MAFDFSTAKKDNTGFDFNSVNQENGKPVDPTLLPDAQGNLKPTSSTPVTSPTFGDNITSFANDTARIAGDAITSGATSVAKSAVGLGAGIIGMGDEAVKAGIATQAAVNVGEAALQALPFGAGTGAAITVLGKTGLPSYLARQSGKISRAAADFLFTAAESPAKVIAIESILGAVSGGADKSVVEATGNEMLGTIAGIVAPVGLASTISRYIFPAYMAKEGFVDAILAKQLRDNPEILARAEDNLATATKGDYLIRLDLLLKSPSFTLLAEQLGTSTPQLEALASAASKELSNSLESAVAAISKGRMTAEEAAKQVDDLISKVATKRDELVASLPQSSKTIQAEGEAAFEDIIGQTYHIAKQSINKAYGKVVLDQPLGKNEAKTLELLAASLVKKATAGGLSIRKSGVMPIVKEIMAEVKSIRKPSEGFTSTFESINNIRGMALEFSRQRALKGEGTEKLRDAIDGISSMLESFPELKKANSIYKELKQVFDNGAISKYFHKSKDGEHIVKVEDFAKDFFLSGNPIERAAELKRFLGSSFAKERGITWADVQIRANEAIIAQLRAGGDMSSSGMKTFMRLNRQSLREFGLEDGYKNVSDVVAEVERLSGKITDAGVRKLSLAKFGFDANEAALSNAVRTNRTALLKEISMLPEHAQPQAMKAVLHSLTYDVKGVLRSPSDISANLLKHGRKFGMSKQTVDNLASLAAHLDVSSAKGASFEEFASALKRDPGLFGKVKSILLERITRPTLKTIRLSSFIADLSVVKGIRLELADAMLTEQGARRILKLARKNPQSALLIRGILYGRAGFIEANKQPQEVQK